MRLERAVRLLAWFRPGWGQQVSRGVQGRGSRHIPLVTGLPGANETRQRATVEARDERQPKSSAHFQPTNAGRQARQARASLLRAHYSSSGPPYEPLPDALPHHTRTPRLLLHRPHLVIPSRLIKPPH
ncbi:hypothetical protein GGR57DRAFT_1967 [Xylariaceae sp. FL1272]|nr:hypothetical protein GGR57DRAFT_1967 [Xylariaceae sp. FL1272]